MDAAHAEELRARTRLQAAGLRVTRPRLVVYSLLREMGGHHSVDEVIASLRRRGTAITRMTVYNVMGTLWRSGLLMRADAGPGRALYEANDNWHHHFVCRRCGVVIDVPCHEGRKPCMQPGGGFSGIVDEAQVIYRGVCERCRDAAPESGADTA